MNMRDKKPSNASQPVDGSDVARAILAALADPQKTINWNQQDPDIKYEGKQITLPNDPGTMSLRDAARILERKADDEETELHAIETIDAFPLDGAVAFVKAMKELYGWASPVPTMTFFGPMPPKMLTVQTGPWDEANNQVQVPWGEFTIPGIENHISIGSDTQAHGPVFYVAGIIKKREQHVLKELANRAREILREGSIYKGKAIRLKVQHDGTINPETPPEFLSTKYIHKSSVILNPVEKAMVQASLWTPIEKTDECRQYHIPLKRGVLLEGPYGGGKSLVATITSKVAVENKWTYILLDDVRALKEALMFAQRYAPAVVFAEDVDRIAEKRDQAGNDLLNTIDGVLLKNAEVITVLTTNYVEKLDKAMLRPGRLDAVVSILPPGPEAVQDLIRMYAYGLLTAGEDLTEVGEVLKGNIAATIREVVERAKLGMIGRGDKKLIASDLITSAHSMKRHMELLSTKPAEITPEQALGAALREVIRPALPLDGSSVGDMLVAFDTLKTGIAQNFNRLSATTKELSTAISQGAKKQGEKLDAINGTINDVGEVALNVDGKVDKIKKAVRA